MRGKFLAAVTFTGLVALLALVGCKQKSSENTAATQGEQGQGAMDYPILLGNDKVADKFGGILGLPTSMLYARDGRKVKTVVGIISNRDEMAKTLETQLDSSPDSAAAAPPEASVAIPTLDGSTVSLDQYKGKVVLVNFWATWCEPCKAEIPWLIEFNHKYGPKGLVILGIAMDDEGKKVVEPWVKTKRFNVSG